MSADAPLAYLVYSAWFGSRYLREVSSTREDNLGGIPAHSLTHYTALHGGKHPIERWRYVLGGRALILELSAPNQPMGLESI